MKLGFAWYKKDQWSSWLKIREDRARLEKSFAEWEELATQHLLDLISQKVDVQKIVVDIDEFTEWCKKHGNKINAESVSEYAAEKVRQRDIGSLLH